jgi:uncharacterized protein YggT (Ycf19 family)
LVKRLWSKGFGQKVFDHGVTVRLYHTDVRNFCQLKVFTMGFIGFLINIYTLLFVTYMAAYWALIMRQPSRFHAIASRVYALLTPLMHKPLQTLRRYIPPLPGTDLTPLVFFMILLLLKSLFE